MLMLLSVHVTSVLFLVRFNNFTLTMGFYWSYTLLLQSPVLMRSWGILGILSVDAVWGIGEMLRLGLGPGNGLPYMMSCKLTRHLVSLRFCYKWCTICSCMQSR